MAGQDPSPQTTLLILLGASSWPLSELTGSTAFEHAARDLRAYFLSDPNGFHLPQSNVLDLFNSDDSNTDILNRISDFLSGCIARGEKSSAGVRDVFVYYIGHGGITTDSSTFYLAIRRTRKDFEKATSLAIDDLAERLKKGARSQRRILILDCCFAARAMRFLQGSAPAALVREKTVAAFKEIDQGVGIPSRGTSFLASSGKDVASVILPDETSTMFTSALLSALRTGDPFQEREQLTLYTVYRLTADFLRRTRRDSFPQPELHSPDQSEGDIATTIALFPNPRAEEIRARRAEEERRRLAEEAEQTRRMEEEKQRRIEEERPEEKRLYKPEVKQASLPEAKQLPGANVQADIYQQNEKRTQEVKKATAPGSASETATIQSVQPGQHYLNAVILGVFLGLVNMLFIQLIPIWAGVDPYPTLLQALPPLVVSLIAGVILGKRREARKAGLLAGLIINIFGFVFVLVKYPLNGTLLYMPPEAWVEWWVLVVATTVVCGLLPWLVAWMRTHPHPYER